MYYNVDKFKGLKACKLRSQIFNSILDSFEARCKMEKLVPNFTFSDSDYGKSIKFSAKAYYVSDGFDFVDVEEIHNDSTISVVLNKAKLDKFLEDDNNEHFENINQALSILAVGNIHDILKSENFIKSTLLKNKCIKKNAIVTNPSFRLCATTSSMRECFGDFTKNIDAFFENAHKYISQNPTM